MKTIHDIPDALLTMANRSASQADAGTTLAIVHDPIGCAGDTVPDWAFCPFDAVSTLHPHGTIVAILREGKLMTASLALRLARKYAEQTGEKFRDWADAEQTFANWLERARNAPDHALAVSVKTWCGKVTRAFFTLHGHAMPKRKPEMLRIAEGIFSN